MEAAPVTGPNGPDQARSSISSLLFMAFIIYLMSGSGEEVFVQQRLQDSLKAAQHEHSNYTAWLNGTESNFTLNTHPAAMQPLVQSFLPVTQAHDPSRSSYWHNLTGFHQGAALFHNLSASDAPWANISAEYIKDLNRTDALDRMGAWNWTSTSKVSLRLSDKDIPSFDNIQAFRGQIDLSNPDAVIKFQFDGIHIPSTGGLYALGTPSGIEPDIKQLSAIVPEAYKNATMHVVANRLKDHIDKIQRLIYTGSSDEGASGGDNTESSCTFLLFGQVVRSQISVLDMTELEDEMQNPTGIRTVPRPPMLLNSILVSPNCGMVIEMKETHGLSADRFWRKATTYSGMASLLYIGLLILLVQQMELTRTPAGISAVSRWVFVLQGVMDSFAFTSHTMFGVLSKNKASLSILVPAFLACILSLMFEVRFTSLIHRIQAPDVAVSLSPPAAPTAGQTENVDPTTAVPSRAPRFVRIRRILNTVTDPDTKFWAILLFIFMFIIQFAVDSPLLLSIIGILHTFWLPQIVRNVNRGTRKALRKTYVLGTSCLRLLLLLYFFACPENILFTDPDQKTNGYVYVLVAWVSLQALTLVGQEYFGAQFFIPKGWVTLPERYDYHPVLPLPDPEAPFDQSLGDCSICMEPVVVHPEGVSFGEKAEGSGAVGSNLLLSVGMRRSYAFTPCSHIMHTPCLERWLAVKNVCPTCRRPLPPL